MIRSKSNIISVVYLVLGAASILLAFLSIEALFEGPYLITRLRRSLMLLAGGLFCSTGLWNIFRDQKLRLLNLAGSATVFMLLLIESIMSFIPYTFGDMTSLNERNWFQLYWQTDSSGIRNARSVFDYHQNERTLAIIGDSYVAGHGIRSVADRFGDRMEAAVGQCLHIQTIGINGLDLINVTDVLKTLPAPPDMLMYVHAANDIDHVLSLDEMFVQVYEGQPDDADEDDNWTKCWKKKHRPIEANFWALRHSYLYNFITMQINHLHATRLYSCMEAERKIGTYENNPIPPGIILTNPYFYYRSEKLFNAHKQHILELSDYCRSKGIELMLVLFPEMGSDALIMDSDLYVARPLKAFADSSGIAAFNLVDVLEEIPQKKRYVNKYNSHPSELANRIIARELVEYLADIEKIDRNCIKQ